MKIYIDIGNTNTTIYANKKKNDLPTIKNDQIYDKIYEIVAGCTSIFVISVVPELNGVIQKLTKACDDVHVLTSNDYPKLMHFLGPDISQMGADRVAIDAYVTNNYSPDSIIIDMGTAVTVDVIKEKTYISGYIYPGIHSSLIALIGSASQLENIQYQNLQSDNVCLTSETQINDGLLIGAIGAINNLVNFAQSHFDKPVNVYITGGYFNMLNEMIDPKTLNNLINFKYIYIKDGMFEALQYLERSLK